MIIESAVRGSSILFTATFLDEEGGAMSPTSVTIRVKQGKTKTINASMTEDSGAFKYRLQTLEFQKNEPFDWYINAREGAKSVTASGSIELTGNSAV